MQTEDQTEDNTVPFQDEKTITLRKPVTLGGVLYATLDLCEPNADQLEKASRAPTQVGMVIELISMVAKVPKTVVGKLCQRDLKAASDFLGSFTEDGPATGATSSPS
ncbi:hypothetical protein AAKU55_005950 [Oxalobacteraceae bacterium GrIS 1.11]